MKFQPKTDWKYDDTPTEADFNRIEQGIADALEGNDPIIQQDTPPDGVKEGRLWLDTSDDTYQGTVFESLKGEIAGHLADEEKHLKVGEREKWNKSITREAIIAAGDWNNYKDTGFYLGQSLENAPEFKRGDHDYWYVAVIKHDANWCVQNAYNFNNGRAMRRVLNDGIWQEWENADNDGATVRPFTVANGKSVARGKPVVVNKDGFIQSGNNKNPIPEFSYELRGQKVVSNYSTGSFMGSVALTENLTVIAHRISISNGDTSTTKFGMLACRLNSDDTMSESTIMNGLNPNSINANNYIYLERLDDSHLVYIAVLNGTTSTFVIEVGVAYVDPITLEITIIDRQNIGTGISSAVRAIEVSAGRILLQYKSSNKNVCRIATWNGSTLTMGAVTDFHNASATYHLQKIEDNRLAASYDRYFLIITTFNDVVQFTTPVLVSSTLYQQASVYVLNRTRLLISTGTIARLFSLNEDNSVTELSILDNIPGFNLMVQTGSFNFIFFNSSTNIYGIYYDLENDIIVSTPTITYSDLGLSKLSDGIFVSMNRIILFYWDNLFTKYIYGYPRGDLGNTVGIALNNALGGSVCDVAISGIVDGLENISPGIFYISRNGELTHSWNGSPYNIAKGVSDTEVLIL